MPNGKGPKHGAIAYRDGQRCCCVDGSPASTGAVSMIEPPRKSVRALHARPGNVAQVKICIHGVVLLPGADVISNSLRIRVPRSTCSSIRASARALADLRCSITAAASTATSTATSASDSASGSGCAPHRTAHCALRACAPGGLQFFHSGVISSRCLQRVSRRLRPSFRGFVHGMRLATALTTEFVQSSPGWLRPCDVLQPVPLPMENR